MNTMKPSALTAHLPLKVYVMDISYFSGKFEAYLRYKEIPYQRILADHQRLMEIFAATGTMKVPAVHTADGLWLKDTTPMIRWFEQQQPQHSIVPQDAALGFLAHLLEDFADEWLWRPAMWWRWEPKVSRYTLGRRIANEVLSTFPAPSWLMTHYFAWRQRRTWLWGDGMTHKNNTQVRDMYLHQLHALQNILNQQPYLLGTHPSLADFGFFGPFFRHFGNDPDPAEIMRQQGPAVYEWTARLWNARASSFAEQPVWIWPDTDLWHPIWKELVCAYLPYLHQNALAWQQGQKRFNFSAGGYEFFGTVTTRYRVWCRQELHRHWHTLDQQAQARITQCLGKWTGWDTFLLDESIDSGLDHDLQVPCISTPSISWFQRAKAWLFGTAR